jgi:hypothetical protein
MNTHSAQDFEADFVLLDYDGDEEKRYVPPELSTMRRATRERAA